MAKMNTSNPNVSIDNKASYGITPTPPSPTKSALSHAVSTSISSTSNSTNTQPRTPPQMSSRASSRYPDSLARVPLHRRGTSNTYECLEDLLREAGYKETRIFTPETDRLESANVAHPEKDVHDRSSGMGSKGSAKGGVINFLAGLMSGAPNSASAVPEDDPTEVYLRQQSGEELDSPLARRRNNRPSQIEISEPSTPNTASSLESLGTLVRPSFRSSPHYVRNTHSSARTSPKQQYTQRSSYLAVASEHSSRRPSPRRAGSHQPSSNTNSSQHTSRAGAYLRHMASAPNMPKRPSSALGFTHPPHGRRSSTFHGNEGEMSARLDYQDGQQPPLPPTWLETVARAVLFGGSGAHVGGPSYVPSRVPRTAYPAPKSASASSAHSNSTTRPGLRQTRSSLSQVSRSRHINGNHLKLKGTLSDHTNTLGALTKQPTKTTVHLTTSSFLPPSLCAQIQLQRARSVEGKVNTTRVLCRSAPVSRAGSRARNSRREPSERSGGARELVAVEMPVVGHESIWLPTRVERGRGLVGKRHLVQDGLPTLAQTRAEGGIWSPDINSESDGNRYLSGWGADGDTEDEYEDAGGNSSSEEEGELDLARMLVPPKRQASIRSLRRHLHGQVKSGGSGGRPGKGRRLSNHGVEAVQALQHEAHQEEDEEEWGADSWSRKRGRSRLMNEGEEEGYEFPGLSRVSTREGTSNGTGKRRRGLPRALARWAGVAV